MNDKEAGRKKEVDEIAPPNSKKIRPGTAGAPIAAPSMGLGAAVSSSEVEHVLSPSFAEANLNDATDGGHQLLMRGTSPTSPSGSDDDSGSDYSPHSNDTSPSSQPPAERSSSPPASYHDGNVDDKDFDYAISHDGFEQDDEVNGMLADCEHESGLDNDSKKMRRLKGVLKNADSMLEIVKGEFEKTYRRRAASKKERKVMKGLIKDILELIEFVEHVDISDYTGCQLEDELNKRRDTIGNAMVQALIDNGHRDLISRINLGSRFSLETLIVFFLHYAPIGCRSVVGDKWNYCDPNQCCIHTMMKKLFNFLVNEEVHSLEQMREWAFGGGQVLDKSAHMAAVDLIPFLLDKKDTEKEMREQYVDVANKFGLTSFYDLMIIPFCLVQMHVKLFEKRQPLKLDYWTIRMMTSTSEL